MTSNRNGLEILSFSLTKDLVSKLDDLSKEIGYQSRSKLITDGVRLLVKKHELLEGMKGTVEGVIILIYDHHAETKVSALRHKFTDVVRAYTHCDFQVRSDRCCEILVFRGEADRVHKIIDGLQAIKNVDEVQVFLA